MFPDQEAAVLASAGTQLVCGDGAVSTGINATAVGPLATSTGTNAATFGPSATATNFNSLAVGSAALSTGVNGAAFGASAQALGSDSTALGAVASAEGPGSGAFGFRARAIGDNSTAIGPSAVSGATRTTAIGPEAQAWGQNASAFGPSARANTDGSLALGPNATTSMNPIYDVPGYPTHGERGVAIGPGSNNTITSGIAIGVEARTDTSLTGIYNPHSSIAIGTSAEAWGNRSIAIGERTGFGSNHPDSYDNTAVGQQAGQYMQGAGNAAFGVNSGRSVAGNSNAAFGFDAGSRIGRTYAATSTCVFPPYYCVDGAGNGSNNTAVGNVAGSDMKGALNTGIGWKGGNLVEGFNNVGIGPLGGWNVIGSGNTGISSFGGATVRGDYNVGIGNSAGANVTGSFNTALGPGAGDTTIGTGNLGLGRNGGRSVQGNDNYGAGLNAGRLVVGDSNFASGSSAGRDLTGNRNYAAGFESGALVTGDDNFAAGRSSGRNVRGNRNLASGYLSGRQVVGDENLAAGADSGSFVQGTGNIAFGQRAGNGLAGDPRIVDRTISIGTEAIAWTSHSIAMGYQAEASVKGGPASTSVAIGNQAKATGVNALAFGTGAQATGRNSISIGTGNVVMADGAAAIGDPNYIGPTAIGTYVLGNDNGTLAAPITTPNSFLIGSNIQASQTLANSLNLGTGSIAYASGTQTAGTAAYPSIVIDGTTYNFAGGTEPAGVVTVGQSGSERRIQNVAAGLISATSTDAINGSQLYALLGAGGGGGGGGDYVNPGWNLQANGGPATNIPAAGMVNVVSGVNTVPTVAGNQLAVNVADSPTFAGTVTTNGLTVNPGGTINMGGNVIQNVGAGVNPTDAVILQQLPVVYSDPAGNPTPAVPGNHVTMVGAGGPVMIHNVAPGTAPTDAVNVSQLPGYWSPTSNTYVMSNSQMSGPVTVSNVAPGELSPTSTQAVNGSQLYATNQAVNNLANVSGDLRNQIRRNEKTANAGISSAMALGQIRYDDRPGKFSMGLGVGTYRSEVGLAIGAGHTSESRLWRFSAGLTWSPSDSRSGVGAAASATYTFN